MTTRSRNLKALSLAILLASLVLLPSAVLAFQEVDLNATCAEGATEGEECGMEDGHPTTEGTCQSAGADLLVCTAAEATGGSGSGTPAAATTIEPRELDNVLGTSSIPELLARIITIFTGISGSIALLMFVYGGVLWLTSRGNADQVEKGKKAIVWAVIGLAIIFGGYAILRTLFTALGAQL